MLSKADAVDIAARILPRYRQEPDRVDGTTQALHVDGYRRPDGTPGSSWQWWQRAANGQNKEGAHRARRPFVDR